MKILIFNWRDLSHPWAGGAEVFIHEVARRWVKQGHRVTWFCGRHPSQPASSYLDGIEIIRRGGIYSVYLQAAAYYLIHFRSQFDRILDSANGIPFFTPVLSRVPRTIMVHHVHGDVFFCEMPRHLAVLANLLEKTAMPWLYRRDSFLTVSESSRLALTALGVPNEHISIVYNGVDPCIYYPGPKSKEPLIAYVGRLRHYKSLHVAIEAMQILRAEVPQAHFQIAGSGLAEDALRQKAKEVGVSKEVTFLGYVSEPKKVHLLQQAHVVVNPSMKEGWGLSVVEANACGTPVIGANVCGLRDSIRHGLTGELVPYGDAPALARALKTVLCDDDLRRCLSRAALEWSYHFRWDQTAEETLDVLDRCAHKRNGWMS
jgi:glycosyltransferase involved in cell wall biosynthesis